MIMAKEPRGKSELVFYQTEDGRTRLEVKLEDETVWLTQHQMAELFQTSVPNVSMHIRNVFSENELKPDSVVKKFLTTAADGKNYVTRFYNLDVIISVGYRVKSLRGVQFRIWATQRLREFIIKGFTLDDERLKQGGGAYFDELKALAEKTRLTALSRSGKKKGSSGKLVFHPVAQRILFLWNSATAPQLKAPVPEGRGDNSPAFQRRVSSRTPASPGGTADAPGLIQDDCAEVLSPPTGPWVRHNGVPALKRRAIVIGPSGTGIPDGGQKPNVRGANWTPTYQMNQKKT